MSRRSKGFTLVEVVISLGVFLLFAVGIYGGIQSVLKSVYQSRLRIIQTGILNEEIEMIRNIAYDEIGILNGSPPGLLDRVVTTTRNGIDLEITRTIRNIDDDFDGTAGGSPNDTAPGDYKLVQVEIICTGSCIQRNPVVMTTRIGPKYLEGNPGNGTLFVQVFDASASPVQGADVHIVATSTSPAYDFSDTTANDGFLRIFDLASGTAAYHITVTKPGYTVGQTVTSSLTIPNPVKPPASVVAQSVTSISFSIDRVASARIRTKNISCQPAPSTSFSFLGTKLWGTNPDVRMVSSTAVTDSQGEYTFNNLIWDSYGVRPTGYDLLGSIPILPISIAPNVNQDIDLILGPDTPNSLLINVIDGITGQPISDALVTVTSTGFSADQQTGVGFIRQTDWSGGTGQLSMLNASAYWSDDGNIDNNNPVGDIKLRLVGPSYVSPGSLESSIFDLGVAANQVALSWEPLAQPPTAGVTPLKFQIATDSTSTPALWSYLGPDGTDLTYYEPSVTAISVGHNGDQYFRYKAFLSTESSTSTPILSDISLSYTTSCTPPGQAYFGSLSNQSYGVEVVKTGYQTLVDSVTVGGDTTMTVTLVAS